MDNTTLRDKTSTSDLLHGRWSEKTGYCYIRLNGDGWEGERNRIYQPVDIMEHRDGLWLPMVFDDQPEIRVYPTGLGEMRDIIMDHPGGVGSTIYRIGVRKRSYLSKKTGKKEQSWELCITDRIDMAQHSLPPTSQVQNHAPGTPPSGGAPNSHIPDGMHSAAPKEASIQGPISPAPAGAIPTPAGEKAQQQAETGLCGCGRDCVAVPVQMGPRAGQTVCLTCGRRVA